MSKLATELKFGNLNSYNYENTGTYTPSGLGIGPLMFQSSGVNSYEQWAGPLPIGIVRPMEYSTAIPGVYPWAMRWSTGIDWVFLADNATAAATRRLVKATYNRATAFFGIDGFLTVTYPTATNHTIRGFRMSYELHNTGVVAAQRNVVSGWNTCFSGDGVCVGNRIGFGTTVPSEVSSWYTITGVTTNTGLTLTTNMGETYASGTPYVIEDLRAIMVNSNATVANGGVYLAKGLSANDFSPAGKLIGPAVTADHQRAVYWLADAATAQNITPLGCAIESKDSFTGQNLWTLEGVSSFGPRLFKHNIRKNPLVPAAGKDLTAIQWWTTGTAIVGTPSQANNGRLAAANHGPGAGQECIYLTTTTRVLRSIPINTITSGMTNWLADAMVEIPAGGTDTFAASSLMNSIEYSSMIDKFLVAVNATTTPFKSYITQYKTDSSQFNRNFGVDTRQTDLTTADSTTTPIPSMVGGPYSFWSEGGILYAAIVGTTAITNRVYAIPVSADWEYASSTNCRLITPEISTPNCNKFVRAYVNQVETIGVGGNSNKNLSLSPEPFRKYYRTAGISDNSGSWTLLDDYSDLSGISGAESIQFMFEFRTIGTLNIPARLLSVCVVYEDNSTLSNYQPSVAFSSISSKQFAWRFATAFGTTVPTLRVRLYDAVSNGLLVDDDTVTDIARFEKSTDGGSNWTAYNTTDKANETTYIRYTPLSLGDNIKVSALLTLN